MAQPVVRKIPTGQSGLPTPSKADKAEQDRMDDLEASRAKLPVSIDNPPGPRGYAKGGAVKGKEVRSANKPMAGADPGMSAMVGGVSNRTVNPSEKKSGARAAFAKGGKVEGIPPYNPGGFRNRGMANRR